MTTPDDETGLDDGEAASPADADPADVGEWGVDGSIRALIVRLVAVFLVFLAFAFVFAGLRWLVDAVTALF